MEIEVHIVMAMTKKVQNNFVKATKDDNELNQLLNVIHEGWPAKRNSARPTQDSSVLNL